MTTADRIFVLILLCALSCFVGFTMSTIHCASRMTDCGIVDLKHCEEIRDGKYRVEWYEVVVNSNAIIKVENNK